MTISALPTPPSPSDSPAAFNSKAFDLLGALPTFVTEANGLEAENAAAASAAATAAANAALASKLNTTNPSYTGTLTGGTGTVNLGSGQVYKAADGKVGLGITAPVQTLHIQDATANDGTMQLGGTSFYGTIKHDASVTGASIYNVASASGGGHIFQRGGATQFMTDAAGNFGLGVTPSAWAAGHRAAEFGSVANSVAALSGGDLNLANNAFLGGSGWVYKISAGATRFQQDFGVSRWLIDSGTKTAGAACNFTTAMTLDTIGNLTLSAGAMGYGTGAGGTVTQVTSKATAVTLNKPSGTVTMHNAALAAGASVLFMLNNTFFGSNDVAVLTGMSWSIFYRVETANSGTGSIGIRVTNTDSVSRSDPLVIGFAIIKGATA